MTNVAQWSTSAGSNNSAPPAGAPEGMLPGKVNDTIREVMAAVCRWYKDSIGTLTAAGGPVAYTLTTTSSYANFTDIPVMAIQFGLTANTGSATLNVDGLGAKGLLKYGTSQLAAGDIDDSKVYLIAYNVAADAFQILNHMRQEAFGSGTLMLFENTNAPLGWTKQVVHNDKSLRITSGVASSGGTTAFSSIFTSRVISSANMPASIPFTLNAAAHTHGAGTYAVGTGLTNGANVAHSLNVNTVSNITGGGGQTVVNSVSDTENTVSLTSGAVTGNSASSGALSVTGTVGGSGTGLDFSVQYVDVIIAQKD